MSRKLKLKISSRLLTRKLKPSLKGKGKSQVFGDEVMKVEIDYKNADFLKSFINDRGKIIPARISGNTAKNQRAVAKNIKLARTMALLPYCAIVR